MPELHLCIYCKKPIYTEAQQYVITNKEDAIDSFSGNLDSDRAKYAHVQCYQKDPESDKGTC